MTHPLKQSADDINALLAGQTAVQLTHSKTLYPHAPGEGIALLTLNSPACTAVIALNGGQLLSFTPTGGQDLLWLSPHCKFSPGASLRGGIPLCLPWFGPHPSDSSKPKHGLARTSAWQLVGLNTSETNTTAITLSLDHSANNIFAHAFSATVTFTLGATLQLDLTLHNTGEHSFDASWVMHNYFAINELDKLIITGLESCQYTDKVHGGEHTQHGPVSISGEVDRVYDSRNQSVQVQEPLQNGLAVSGENCPSVVVWNPGATLAASIGDIGPGGERGFVCVERGACLDNIWTLAAGEQRRARMVIQAQ